MVIWDLHGRSPLSLSSVRPFLVSLSPSDTRILVFLVIVLLATTVFQIRRKRRRKQQQRAEEHVDIEEGRGVQRSVRITHEKAREKRTNLSDSGGTLIEEPKSTADVNVEGCVDGDDVLTKVRPKFQSISRTFFPCAPS